MLRELRHAAADPLGQLTPRETDVLKGLAQGRSNREIARALSVSDETVKSHVSSILAKLGLADRTQAAIFALQRHLVPLDLPGEERWPLEPLPRDEAVALFLGRARPVRPTLEADASRMEQVLVNLILNALDAMPEGGELAIRTELVSGDMVSGEKDEARKQFVLITVADTGIGIPENLQPNIFDPFFTTKPDGKGAGLGLSSARAIVRQHDGYIKVQSAPGAGTKFFANDKCIMAHTCA